MTAEPLARGLPGARQVGEYRHPIRPWQVTFLQMSCPRPAPLAHAAGVCSHSASFAPD